MFWETIWWGLCRGYLVQMTSRLFEFFVRGIVEKSLGCVTLQ